ncbi:MAG: hypothetical protein JO325_23210, partial [Solirubrobacterales bacterium]|nr:hypothetical protein [Solirubrobacterales bacterium]
MSATDQDLTLDAGNEHRRPANGDTPGFLKRHRRALLSLLGGLAALGFFYYMVPQIAGL